MENVIALILWVCFVICLILFFRYERWKGING